jgi:hypothetical protein
VPRTGQRTHPAALPIEHHEPGAWMPSRPRTFASSVTPRGMHGTNATLSVKPERRIINTEGVTPRRRLALPSRIDKTDRAGPATDCPSSRRLMSDRVDFEIVCPNDHNQTVTFSQKEFEETLKSGALVFHCNTCDANWPPSHEDIAKIRKQFSKHSS